MMRNQKLDLSSRVGDSEDHIVVVSPLVEINRLGLLHLEVTSKNHRDTCPCSMAGAADSNRAESYR